MAVPDRLMGFSIGSGATRVDLANPLALAPMAGVCDMPYRLICKQMGCAIVYTEMISAMGLMYGDPNTAAIMQMSEAERPVAAQVFGSDPAVVARAARIMEQKGADIIDINMGCPVPKIVKNREGSALMRRPDLAARIVEAVRRSVSVPVTVKIRKGWDDYSVNAVDFACMCESVGADAIAVHGRTRAQGYSGKADWNIIGEVARAVTIPVMGNGDVTTPQQAAALMQATGCSGVMIGRAAMGNPWIFARTLSYLETGTVPPEPGPRQRLAMAMRHLEMMAEFKGERVAAREMRKHLAWYIRGLRGSARMRDAINTAPDCASLREVVVSYLESFGE